jgi:hypothetical protein
MGATKFLTKEIRFWKFSNLYYSTLSCTSGAAAAAVAAARQLIYGWLFV